MKRILYSLLLATLPFGSALADAPKSKNAKVTLVYQHELPNAPGKSIKGVLVEYGPGGYSPGHTLRTPRLAGRASLQRIHEPHRLALRRVGEATVAHHHPAADDGAHRPAGHRHAVVGRPAGAAGDPAVLDGAPRLQVDQGD